MSKGVDYRLRVLDYATAPFKKIMGGSDQVVNSFKKIDKQAAATGARSVGWFDRMREKIRGVGDESQNTQSRMKGFNIGGLVRGIGGSLAIGGLTLGAILGGAIGKGMENDLQKTNITTLMRGDVEKANKLFSELSQYAVKTPYEKADIIEAQKTMMSFGLTSDFAFSKLRNIGDIALGDANKMKSLSLAFSQATSAGTLQGQDLLQMINAGFNPLQAISERTGQSMATLKDKMEEGGISAKMLSQAFEWATDKQGLFYKGAEKASTTFAGKVSNLKDAFSEGLIAIYEELKPILTPILDRLITGVSKMTTFLLGAFKMVKNALTWVWDKFKEGNPIILALTAIMAGFIIKAVAAQVVTMAISVATGIWTGAQWLLNAAMTANPIGLIIAGIVVLIALIAHVIYRYEGWGEAWQNLVSFLDYSWQAFKEGFYNIWLRVVDSFMSGIEKMQRAWYAFSSLWDKDGANAGLASLQNKADARAKELAESNKRLVKHYKQASESWDKIGLKDTGKTWEDALGDVKKKLGFSGSTGGAQEAMKEIGKKNSLKNTDDTDVNGASDAGEGKSKKINEGGSRPTSINITIGKLQEQLIVNTNGGAKEGGKQAGIDIVNEILMALNSVDQKEAQLMAYNVSISDLIAKLGHPLGFPFPTGSKRGDAEKIAQPFTGGMIPDKLNQKDEWSFPITKVTDEQLGRYAFMPAYIDDGVKEIELPNALVTISGEKGVIETDVIDRGTVFEKMYERPYEISIVFTIIGDKWLWPSREYKEIAELYRGSKISSNRVVKDVNTKDLVTLKCALTNPYLQPENNFLITKITILDNEGAENVEVIQIDGKSNIDFELIIN